MPIDPQRMAAILQRIQPANQGGAPMPAPGGAPMGGPPMGDPMGGPPPGLHTYSIRCELSISIYPTNTNNIRTYLLQALQQVCTVGYSTHDDDHI